MAMAPPELDTDQWNLTVWGSSRDPATLGVVKGFERDANLTPFVAQPPGKKRPWANFNVYYVDDTTQRFRFQQHQMAMTGPWPVVTLQPPRNKQFGDPRVIVDRIEARDLGQPADLKKRIQASVLLFCKKMQVARLDRPGGHQQAAPEGPASFPWGPEVPPPVAPISPQWPPGGPANDPTSGSTLAQLRAACPGAPAEFLLAQLEARATIEQAQAAFRLLQPTPSPVTLPVPKIMPAPDPNRPLLQILIGLLGSQMLLSFALPFVQAWATKAKATPSPVDDLVSGFVLKALETRLQPPANPVSPPPAR
jgi:hypothetical protein